LKVKKRSDELRFLFLSITAPKKIIERKLSITVARRNFSPALKKEADAKWKDERRIFGDGYSLQHTDIIA
jgi:hypothetical protein